MSTKYYDHERAYRMIVESGGTGWDDLPRATPSEKHEATRGTRGPVVGVVGADRDVGSYAALDEFLASAFVTGTAKGDALDLGCGGGQASMKLAARGFRRVVGIDFASSAIELAHRNASAAESAIALAHRNASAADHDLQQGATTTKTTATTITTTAPTPMMPTMTFVVGDCLALDLPDASFDLAVDNHVLHCIIGPDRTRFLAEVARVLRPGGLFFSDTMSREGHVDFARHQINTTTFVSNNGNRYLVSETELDAELTQAGFEILSRHTRIDTASAIGNSLTRISRRRSAPTD